MDDAPQAEPGSQATTANCSSRTLHSSSGPNFGRAAQPSRGQTDPPRSQSLSSEKSVLIRLTPEQIESPSFEELGSKQTPLLLLLSEVIYISSLERQTTS